MDGQANNTHVVSNDTAAAEASGGGGGAAMASTPLYIYITVTVFYVVIFVLGIVGELKVLGAQALQETLKTHHELLNMGESVHIF